MQEKENEKNLTSKVEAINALLRTFGRQAVQEIKMMKNGQVIGQVRYGYKPQMSSTRSTACCYRRTGGSRL